MDENETLHKIAKLFAENAEPVIHCPACEKGIQINMRESLEPYAVSLVIDPMKGRAIDAKVLAAQIKHSATMFESIGKAFKHKTMTVVLGVNVDENMRTEIKFAFIPIKMGTK